jgi:shikimate dehydrogenase
MPAEQDLPAQAIEPNPDAYLKLGIIGFPLKHTLSPVFQSRLLELANRPGEYLPYELDAEALKAHLANFSQQGGCGLNVTIPYKVAVLPHLDWVSPEAQMLGAVNTVVFETQDATSKGYNTDITGFVRSLPTAVVKALPNMHVLLLGAGGSARAVAAGLIQQGVGAITLSLRNPEKAADFMASMETMVRFYQGDAATQTCLSWRILDDISALPDIQGIVNTTPLGMWPETQASPLSSDILRALAQNQSDSTALRFVYDLIYRPLKTQFMRDAVDSGYSEAALTINGLDMLIHQGIAAFELWAFGDKRSSPLLPANTVTTLRTCLLDALTL